MIRKTICPLVSEKKLSTSLKITLFEKCEIVTDNAKIAEAFSTFFSNIIKTLNIEKNEGITCNTDNEKDAILRAIKK